MGRVDDKEGESLLSEAEEEKEKDRETSEAEEEKEKDRDTSEVDEGKDTEKEASDLEDSEPDSHKKYKCTQPGCTARFLRPSRLTWHLRKHNDERPYKCDQEGCTRAYTNSSHLKRHLNTTHKPTTKTYECKECGMELGSLFSLKRHNKKIHDPTRLTCTECGAKFRKKHCYNEHLSMHAGVAMYKCDECDQTFTTLRLYKKHHRIHESLKTYPCTSEGCTEVFDKWSKLSKHLETEHEFDYKCKKCNKEFKHKKQLHVHSVAHTREDVVVLCPYQNCPRFYSHERNLNEHILTVHMGRKFICDMCHKKFSFKSAIARHIQVIHEGKPPPPSYRKKPRRRKDAGIPKKSMVAKLIGVELPTKLEKRLLRRRPQINLEAPAMESREADPEEERNAASSSSIDADEEGKVPNASKESSEGRRKDAGIPKKSTVAKIIGVELPTKLEKRLLRRRPQINLEAPAMESREADSEEERNAASSSFVDADERSKVASKESSVDKEESFLSSEKNNEVISSRVTIAATTASNKSDKVTMMDFAESGEVYEEILLPVIDATETETPMVLDEFPSEKSFDNATEIPELTTKKNSEITTIISDIFLSETPIIFANCAEEFANIVEENKLNEIIPEANASSGEIKANTQFVKETPGDLTR